MTARVPGCIMFKELAETFSVRFSLRRQAVLTFLVVVGIMPAHAQEGNDRGADPVVVDQPVEARQPGNEAPDPAPLRVLTVGGGTSHDFDRWFDREDSAILSRVGVETAYTDMPAHVPAALDTIDVLRLTTNQPLSDVELFEDIFYFVGAGKGLVIGHAGAWYNWQDWPEYNQELVGGGARHHRRYGGFEVRVVDPDHPVMAQVPGTFSIEDELYRFERDPEGSPMHVLAVAEEPETGETWPIVWTVHHTNGRVVVNTLGHDGMAHRNPAYVRILRNSVEWAARRTR